MDTAILRSRILDMAIRGQLIPQDPNEGTADDLLKAIAAQRGKPITPITDNVPFEIPANWRWVKLGDISNYGECISEDVHNLSKDAWILELEDLEKGSARIIQRITLQDRQIKGIRREFHKGSILYSKLRTYLNKVLIAPTDGYCTTEIVPFDTFCYNPFVCQILRSPYYLGYTAQLGYGVKMPRMSSNDVKKSLIPLPPLAEQHRIVAKVEELLSKVDKIEQAQTDITHAATILRSRILDMAFSGALTKSNIAFWNVETLDQACLTISAGGDRPLVCKDSPTDNCNVPIYSNGVEKQGLYGYTTEAKCIKPCITISARGTIGYPFIRETPFVPIVRLITAVPNPSKLDLRYLYYYILHLRPQSTGTSTPQLTIPDCKLVSIPLPPLPEQRRIVAKIEELFAEIDKLK